MAELSKEIKLVFIINSLIAFIYAFLFLIIPEAYKQISEAPDSINWGPKNLAVEPSATTAANPMKKPNVEPNNPLVGVPFTSRLLIMIPPNNIITILEINKLLWI